MTTNQRLTVATRQPPKVVSPKYGNQRDTTGYPDQVATEYLTNLDPKAYGKMLSLKDAHGTIRCPKVMDLDETERVILIRRVYSFSSFDQIVQTISQNYGRQDELTDEGKLLLQELEKLAGLSISHRRQHYTIRFQYRITLNEIQAVGGAIHHVETDLVIGLEDAVKQVTHPRQVIADGDVNRPQIPMEQCGHFWIGINDPLNTQPDRFITQGKNIVRLIPFRDTTMDAGVWVCRMQHWDPAIPAEPVAKYVHYPTLEDYDSHAEEEGENYVPIYRGYEDAVRALEERSALLARQARDHEYMVMQTKLQKSQNDLEAQTAIAEELRLKGEQNAEKHRQEMEAMDKKERYEHRSYIRRETSESFKFSTDMIKYVPIVLIGLGAAYVAIKATFSRGG